MSDKPTIETVANDVKWLVKNVGEMVTHLETLNGKTNKNTTRSIVNRYGLCINFSVVVIIITILLHLMGVY